MTKHIAFISGKGGVGKSTHSHNFGYFLACQGKKVKYIDCDPQGALSRKVEAEKVLNKLTHENVENYDYVIYDTNDNFDQGSLNLDVIKASDFIVTPVILHSDCLIPLVHFLRFLDKTGHQEKFLGVIPNLVKNRNLYKGMKNLLDQYSTDYQFKIFTPIPELKDFFEASYYNETVFEYAKSKKSIPVLTKCYLEICDEIQ